MKNAMEEVVKYLPEGWEEAAREKGAFKRGRGIKNAEELLILNLLYLTEGTSYQATSTLMRLAKNIRINKTATKKRIVKSKEWLKWLSENISLENGFTIPTPSFLGNKNLLLIDASDISIQGSKGSDFRLHHVFNLFKYRYESTAITTIKEGGEKLTRYTFTEKDIVIADRVYGTIYGIEHVQSFGSNYILRLRTKAFTLYDENGDKVDIYSRIVNLKDWESMSIPCFYKHNGEFHAIRICSMKKDAKACEESKRKAKAKASKKQTPLPSKEAAQLNEYIIVATSLEYTEEQIFELYRARWQIECVFLRLKSLFGVGDVPSRNEDSVLTWLYGKMFLATLCEAIEKEGHALAQEMIAKQNQALSCEVIDKPSQITSKKN